MPDQPTTSRQHSERDGRPCVHMTDEDGDALQVHHRADAPSGFSLVISASITIELAEGAQLLVPADLGFYITSDQAQQLMAYFKAEL